MANPASGQMTPRTSQCSGRLVAAATNVADSIFTWSPNDLEARASHFMAGSAASRGAAAKGRSQSAFMDGSFQYYRLESVGCFAAGQTTKDDGLPYGWLGSFISQTEPLVC